MKITITIEIDGVPLATKSVTAFDAVDEKPCGKTSVPQSWYEEYERLMAASKPLGEEVPDEEQAPELVPPLPEDELKALRNDYGDIAEAAPEPEPRRTKRPVKKKFLPELEPEPPKIRGPYKKKEKTCDDPNSPPKYLGPNTVAEMFKTEGMTINLPGIQTTSKKFIVANAYFKGDLYEARDGYRQYVTEQHKHYPLDDMILTWGSWLCNHWNKKGNEQI